MNKRFPLLSLVSVVLRALGLLTTLVGLYYVLYEGIIEPNLPNHVFAPSDATEMAGGFVGLLAGLALIAFGEIIGVLFAIEANTRPRS
ncbi:MAG: hypothetical protein WC655_27885 [Candidatus Hydrogenedentales bacterium]|jgi:hypothetical protein